MQILADPASMRAWAGAQVRRVGLVPTMGALHEGHLRLVEVAARHADIVVVSIFVNPLQFDRLGDFETYPRPIDDDVATCTAAGVAAVYAPTAAAMYPEGFQTHVMPGALGDVMEGAMRPGHFRGVSTVVAKLLHAVAPTVAVFGRKDFQQLAVVRAMVRDLDMGVEIVGVPTVREPDGLAMSSRNRRLTPPQRRAASCVPRSLQAAELAFARGERSARQLQQAAAGIVAREADARLEYVTVVDDSTLLPLAVVDGAAVVATAVWFGDVRLIDNVELR